MSNFLDIKKVDLVLSKSEVTLEHDPAPSCLLPNSKVSARLASLGSLIMIKENNKDSLDKVRYENHSKQSIFEIDNPK